VTDVATVLREAVSRLREAGVEGPRLDAEVLLAACLERDRAWLHGRPEAPVPEKREIRFLEWIARRCGGLPVAYLTGTREFHGLDFTVEPGVFLPRPETEGLVDRASRLAETSAARVLVDACTGCGNVAIASALHAGFERVGGTDLDPGAIELARRNADALGTRVDFRRGDLLEPFLGTEWEGTTDVVLSNPPYVERHDLSSLPKEVRREPARALDGGPDGLDVIRRLARQARALLRSGGHLVVEIGEREARGAIDIARRAGLVEAGVEADLAGRPRYLLARKKLAPLDV